MYANHNTIYTRSHGISNKNNLNYMQHIRIKLRNIQEKTIFRSINHESFLLKKTLLQLENFLLGHNFASVICAVWLAHIWVINIADNAPLGFQLYLHKAEWQIPETITRSNSLNFIVLT